MRSYPGLAPPSYHLPHSCNLPSATSPITHCCFCTICLHDIATNDEERTINNEERTRRRPRVASCIFFCHLPSTTAIFLFLALPGSSCLRLTSFFFFHNKVSRTSNLFPVSLSSISISIVYLSSTACGPPSCLVSFPGHSHCIEDPSIPCIVHAPTCIPYAASTVYRLPSPISPAHHSILGPNAPHTTTSTSVPVT